MTEEISKTKAKDGRARSWTFVVYPESAPDDWRERLDQFHVPWVESPLHDKDINPNGEPKKHHWHIAVTFEGKKSYEQVKEISDTVNAAPPQSVHEMRGLIRYFAHIDNPEKAQYAKEDIRAHGGFDLDSMFEPTASQRHKLIKEMQRWCRDNGITEFAVLSDYASEERYEDWYAILCDSAGFIMREYLKSLWRMRQRGGEV